MKLTPWFKETILPKRIGVYEAAPSGHYRYFSYFDGVRWNGCWDTPDQAMRMSFNGPCSPVEKWRGLAEKP